MTGCLNGYSSGQVLPFVYRQPHPLTYLYGQAQQCSLTDFLGFAGSDLKRLPS